MNHYINNTNQIFGFEDDQKSLIPKDVVLIPENFTIDQYPYLTLEKGNINFNSSAFNENYKKNLIVKYELIAQENLDAIAQSWGYSSIVSAASYANSTNAQFKAEAEALIAWRDTYWTQAYTIEAGTLPATAEAFVAELPAAPIKPTA